MGNKKDNYQAAIKTLIPAFVFLILFFSLIGINTAAVSLTNLADVRVRGESTFNKMNVNNYAVNQDPDPAEPGGIVTVRWKIENTGREAVNNLILEVEPSYPLSLVAGESARQVIGSLESRQTGKEGVIVKYRFIVAGDAPEGTYEINLRYSADNGKTWVKLRPFNLDVKNVNLELLVSDVRTTPERVAPGKSFNISFRITNLEDNWIENVRTELELEKTTTTTTTVSLRSYPFIPVGSTNYNVIKSMPAGKSYMVKFNLMADPTADSNAYNLPLRISYKDSHGNNFSREYYIGIIVYDPPSYVLKLDSNGVYSSKKPYSPDARGKIVIGISNTGRGDMNFVALTLEDTKKISVVGPREEYVGNLKSDDYESAEFEVATHKESRKTEEATVRVKVEFKDALNNPVTQYRELPIKLYSRSDAEKLGLVLRENKSSMFMLYTLGVLLVMFWLAMIIDCIRREMSAHAKLLWLATIILANILGAAIYFLFGRKKKI